MAEALSAVSTPLRILYVENGIGYGGAIICLRHLVRNLDRRRFEPIVVTGKDLAPYRSIAEEARWLPIRDRYLDTLGWQRRVGEWRLAARAPRVASMIRKVIGRVDDIVNFTPFFVRLLLAAMRLRPALIHANNDPLCNRAALLVGKLTGVPVISHVRGLFDQPTRTLRWLYSLPAHFIAVSQWIARGTQDAGVAPASCTVVYDGIELEKLDPNADGLAFRRRYRIPERAFAVGLVGLLIPWKGQRLFLEAARTLVRRIPGVHIVIVGGTPETCADYEQELRVLADDPALSGRVTFTGHVAEMATAYQSLDVVVSASTSPEPLGTVVIESLALGRPLVAPAHGGAAEMVDHGRTGLLFAPGDAAALADAICRFHADPNLRRGLGAAARVKALRTFAVQEHVERVQSIYERLLGAAGKRRQLVADSSARTERDAAA